jgi:hypothetical protein
MLVLDRVGKIYPNGARRRIAEADAGEILVSSAARLRQVDHARAISASTPTRAGRARRRADHGRTRRSASSPEPRLPPWLRVADNVGFGLEAEARATP